VVKAAPATANSLAADVAPCTSCAGSGPSVDAASGNVAAHGVQNQAALANQQTSVVDAGSGNNQTAAANTNNSTIDDKGAATGQSGLAAAQTGALTAPSGGQANAQSGGASATGLNAQNVVVNGSQAVVQVGGANSGAISIQNANTVLVQDRGAAAANSGAALSSIAPTPTPTPNASLVTGGAALTTKNSASIAAPVADASPSSDNVSSIGSIGTNTLFSSQSAAVVAPAGTPTAISILQAQNLAVTTGSQAAATSSGACAGSDCPATQAGTTNPPPSAAPVPVPPATASNSAGAAAQSGAAVARGAIVQNLVNTAANVQVLIGGDNHGIIQVIINSLTNILNQGSAEATSGGATANNPSAAAPPPPSAVVVGANASSGSAQTIGSVVNNAVGLQSSASVHVDGDNHNPITIILNLTARLFNLGEARATSGDARANGQAAGATAQSGSAVAAGLVAQNQVALGADASVDITGNNYADITIELEFDTAIQNIGKAVAVSGQSQASSIAPPSASSSTAAAQVGSVQTNAAANTDAPAPTTDTSASPAASTSGAVQMPATSPLHVDVRSGNGKAVGVDDTVVASNSQVSVASGSQNTAGSASDSATYTIAACGKAMVGTGSTYVNTKAVAAPAAQLISPDTLCPTPTPTVAPSSGDTSGNQANGSGTTGSGTTQQEPAGTIQSGQSGPFGPMVRNGSEQAPLSLPAVQPASGTKRNINLFGIWPAPDQPMTPNQQIHVVPPPRPVAPAAPMPLQAAGPLTGVQTRVMPVSPSPANLGQIARNALQTGVKGVNTVISPFGAWPGTDDPMMPDPHMQQRVVPAIAVAAVAAPPAGPAIGVVSPRVSVPFSSILLLITVLTGAMALIARSLWQRPALRAGLAAAYGFVAPPLVGVIASVHRGRRWIARAATLFFVLVLALMQWRR
jgi:hypothetical protein